MVVEAAMVPSHCRLVLLHQARGRRVLPLLPVALLVLVLAQLVVPLRQLSPWMAVQPSAVLHPLRHPLPTCLWCTR